MKCFSFHSIFYSSFLSLCWTVKHCHRNCWVKLQKASGQVDFHWDREKSTNRSGHVDWDASIETHRSGHVHRDKLIWTHRWKQVDLDTSIGTSRFGQFYSKMFIGTTDFRCDHSLVCSISFSDFRFRFTIYCTQISLNNFFSNGNFKRTIFRKSNYPESIPVNLNKLTKFRR
jgi:hypothetical protein